MTGAQDWRTQRWEATHQRIYDTALGLFHEHGFDRVSVGQIAAAAGVSVPTFYAHYPSKEHVVMALPTAEQINHIIKDQPTELPIGERIRRGAVSWCLSWTEEYRQEHLGRWRIIATTPALRSRAAEFERTTAGMVADALPAEDGAAPSPGDSIVVNAYLAAFTAALLAWADCEGSRKLEDVLDEAFAALQQR